MSLWDEDRVMGHEADHSCSV